MQQTYVLKLKVEVNTLWNLHIMKKFQNQFLKQSLLQEKKLNKINLNKKYVYILYTIRKIINYLLFYKICYKMQVT